MNSFSFEGDLEGFQAKGTWWNFNPIAKDESRSGKSWFAKLNEEFRRFDPVRFSSKIQCGQMISNFCICVFEKFNWLHQQRNLWIRGEKCLLWFSRDNLFGSAWPRICIFIRYSHRIVTPHPLPDTHTHTHTHKLIHRIILRNANNQQPIQAWIGRKLMKTLNFVRGRAWARIHFLTRTKIFVNLKSNQAFLCLLSMSVHMKSSHWNEDNHVKSPPI